MARDGRTLMSMCRNITALRGLEPPATAEEVEAAARQFVRKVAALSSVSPALEDDVQRASHDIALVVSRLLAELPPRRVPPTTVPPNRRRGASAAS